MYKYHFGFAYLLALRASQWKVRLMHGECDEGGVSVCSNALGVTLSEPTRPEGVATIIRLTVNGRERKLTSGEDFARDASLADVLRDVLGLTGVKVACSQGACGACTVIMNGRPVLSCMTLAASTDGADVLTVEGLDEDDPLIIAFANQSQPGHGTAIQCGFCSPGMVMTAKALLMQQPDAHALPRWSKPSPATSAAAVATQGSSRPCSTRAPSARMLALSPKMAMMGGREDSATHDRFVGSYSPRIDGAAKASGRADFLADIAVGLR